MAETLVIRLSGEGPATWTVVDNHGRRTASILQGPLAAAADHVEGRPVIALVPGTEVLLSTTELPVRGHAKQLRMVPYSLEEGLAADVEKLSFAIGHRNDAGEIPVAVADSVAIHGWLDQLAEVGVHPEAVYSDSFGVPDTPGTVTAILERDRTYIRKPGELPFCFDGLGIDQALDICFEADELSRCHVLVYAEEEVGERYSEYWPAIRERLASLDVQILEEGALGRMAGTLVTGTSPSINLLQGALAPRSDWLELARPWQLAASLLIGLILIAAAAEGLEYFQLKRKHDTLQATLTTTCKRVFPGSSQRECGNLANQALSVSGPGNGDEPNQPFLPTLAVIGEALGGAQLKALDFRSGVMNLRVLAPNVASLDQIQRGIASNGGFSVDIQSANPVDGGVEGRLQVKRPE